jgi:hypothetical protein
VIVGVYRDVCWRGNVTGYRGEWDLRDLCRSVAHCVVVSALSDMRLLYKLNWKRGHGEDELHSVHCTHYP